MSHPASDALRAAPWWLHLAVAVVSRLPAGRYRALGAIGRRLKTPFWMRLPALAGGHLYRCDLRDAIAREVCFTGRYEPQETALLRSMLAPGMTFVDVGANWGYFTLLAAHLVGSRGRVLAVEADPRMFQTLSANVARNSLLHVGIVHVAIAASEGYVTLSGFDEASGEWGLSRVVGSPGGATGTFTVPSAALDDILDERAIDQVDVLKMDIEGAEEYALVGMAAGLERHRYRRIVFEVHPGILAERGRNAWDVLRVLSDAGYRGWWIDHSPEATRRAAYAKFPAVGRYLRPLTLQGTAASWRGDAWPHVLWLAPGVPMPGVSRAA